MPKKTDPIVDLGQAMGQEISQDAPAIARDLFQGRVYGHQSIPDAQAAELMRQAYLRGDRTTLTQMAQQNPGGFLRVWTKHLGGTVPPKPEPTTSAPPPVNVSPQMPQSPGVMGAGMQAAAQPGRPY